MSYLSAYIFICGAVGRVSVNVIGELYITELMLGVAGVILVARSGKMLFRGSAGWLFLFGTLWLLSQVFTDFYRTTPFEDWTRGWAKIIFFLIDFGGLILLTKLRMDRILIFFAGFACSYLLQSLFFPDYGQAGGEFVDGMWKFGLSAFFDLGAAVLSASPMLPRLLGASGEFIPLATMGIVNLVLNSRGAFGVAMAAVAFGMLKRFFDLWPGFRAKLTPLTFAILIGGGGVFSRAMFAIYETAAANDWLGQAAKGKYEAQTAGQLNLFQAGRTESLASTQAIADSPIIGHGSWAKDVYYVAIMVDRLEAAGIKVEGDPYGEGLIPTHSHVLGSWVEAGMMGGLFWIVVFILTIVALYRSLKVKEVPGTFAAFVLISLLWSIPFSPFANTFRINDAATLCVILSIYRSYQCSSVRNRSRKLAPIGA